MKLSTIINDLKSYEEYISSKYPTETSMLQTIDSGRRVLEYFMDIYGDSTLRRPFASCYDLNAERSELPGQLSEEDLKLALTQADPSAENISGTEKVRADNFALYRVVSTDAEEKARADIAALSRVIREGVEDDHN